MTTTINASTSAGLVQTADTTGNLSLQANGTTILALTSAGAAVTGTLSASGAVTISGTLTGGAPLFSPITAYLSADVALSNTANYFTGPSVAQGSIGTWFVMGTVSVQDNAAGLSVGMRVKLWDGTTLITSAYTQTPEPNFYTSVTLCGFITSPAGNLRISVRDENRTTGFIVYDMSGNGRDSNITAIRIG